MKIIFNSNQIDHETEKAYLIKLPKSDLGFWYPKRFINFKGKNNFQIEVWFGNMSWEIKVIDRKNKSSKNQDCSIAEAKEIFNLQIKD